MRFRPKRANVPVYIGGQGDKMLEYSGADGDGALPLLYPSDFAEYAVKKISEGARKAGKDPRKVDIAGCVWMSIAKDQDAAVTTTLRELVAYFGPLLGAQGFVGGSYSRGIRTCAQHVRETRSGRGGETCHSQNAPPGDLRFTRRLYFAV